jgi:geranylgeranyl reductase family protein
LESVSDQTLPDACDVLVIGAGPAGSACAHWLARHGRDVLLLDQQSFPRDKVCGDGLIPDAHAALQRLGVAEAVRAVAHTSSHVACVGPRGGRIEVPGRLAVLPRRELDKILLDSARAAGARFVAPWRLEAPLREDGRVAGAQLVGPGGERRTVRCRWLVLATGALPQALIGAGVCQRRLPSGMALRGYVRNPAMVDRIRCMEVVWHRSLRPGYGWIFPAGDGVFNIGVGLTHSHAEQRDGRPVKREVNLRRVLEAFCEAYGPARELVQGGTWLAEPKGAPLRFSLEGADWSAPGLLVTGEAAGSTYSFTGEGIGKALETGLLAAEALLSPTAATDDGAVRQHYEAALAQLRPKFALYEKANRVNAHPWLADLLIWRAQRSPGLVRRMSGILDETSNPASLFTARGIAKLLLPMP